MNKNSSAVYKSDKDFLKKHLNIIELKNGKSSILVSAEYQARVMTSTCGDEKDLSLGWINYKAIESKELDKQINVYGGEERFWLGPEGGQYSIYFKKGVDFDFKNWFVPKAIDIEPFDVVKKEDASASFVRDMKLVNYSGFEFNLKVERDIEVLDVSTVGSKLGIDLKDIDFVGYQTTNSITNTGDKDWKKETGCLSIWLLGMMNPSPELTVVAPVNDGDLGVKVNDDYFGEIPESDLKTVGNHVFLKADGKRRGKIGISHARSAGVIGSYDAINKVLTIVQYDKPTDRTEYVNSAWELQEKPYSGDVINSYNDGPLEDGSQLGPFYEIETSSPAADLTVGEKMTHVQRTFHFVGSEAELNEISKKVLKVSIEEIKKAF
jgi:hypothetical protein